MAGDKNSTLKDLVQAESMVQVAIALPLGCAVGWLVGNWLDHRFHQQWIGIVGILLGAVGGFIQIVRLAMRSMNRDTGNRDTGKRDTGKRDG